MGARHDASACPRNLSADQPRKVHRSAVGSGARATTATDGLPVDMVSWVDLDRADEATRRRVERAANVQKVARRNTVSASPLLDERNGLTAYQALVHRCA